MWLLSYWIFPLISACVWLGMLLAMFIDWEAIGHPIYPSMEKGQTIAYISDVGAEGLKPLFIAGCVVTTVFLDLSFASERWLRHKGVLARNIEKWERIFSICSIVAALAGTLGLILLSIFDTLRHHHLHDAFLCLFIAGYVVSAIFICAEYQRLGIHYRNHRVLRISFWIKLAFILVEVAMAIGFGVCNTTGHRNAAAVLEWLIALIFTFYVLSFLIDLLPSVRTKHHIPQGLQSAEMGKTGPMMGEGDMSGDPLTHDSQGDNAGRYFANGNANPVAKPEPIAGHNF